MHNCLLYHKFFWLYDETNEESRVWLGAFKIRKLKAKVDKSKNSVVGNESAAPKGIRNPSNTFVAFTVGKSVFKMKT